MFATIVAAIAETGPDIIVAAGGIIDRYGLPLAILAGLLWLLLTRRLILGHELAYVEARRVEEREGRLAAEATNKVLTDAVDKMGDGMAALQETIATTVERALADDREERRRASR